MQVEYAKGGRMRFSLRNRPLDRDTADVRKNNCAGCIWDCERRVKTVGNLSSGQAPIRVQQ
jgi:phage-related protein